MTAGEFTRFLETHLKRVEPLNREVNLAYWSATISGRSEDFDRSARLQIELQQVYADPHEFERIRRWRDDTTITDPVHKRQITLLYNAYVRNQIDAALNERITTIQSKIENQFSVHRATIGGKPVTSNDILAILKDSDDERLRREAWDAGKRVGAVVHEDLLNLVRLRNEAARSIGYDNYYAMSMELNEQDETEILTLFEELESLTRVPFAELKAEVDTHIARRFGISPSHIRPWHYEDPFFQEAPRIYDVDLDAYYTGRDVVDLVSRFYRGIGLEVDQILARSDLYEKPGKDQHAFCTDIDRNGDIRILANIKDDESWTGTMLHELGHAVHDLYVDPELPYLLRQEAHIFTTEAIAMLFGRLSKDPEWIRDSLGISEKETGRIAPDINKSLRLHQLVFSRWSQVMLNFERQLYMDPEQDLNRLWWDLAQELQLLTPPERTDFPHWASKTHIVSAPVYYHNYLLGELLASQLDRHIRHNVLPSASRVIYGQRSVGDYLKKRVFGPGASYRWDELIVRATGESLTPKYFVAEFVAGAR